MTLRQLIITSTVLWPPLTMTTLPKEISSKMQALLTTLISSLMSLRLLATLTMKTKLSLTAFGSPISRQTAIWERTLTKNLRMTTCSTLWSQIQNSTPSTGLIMKTRSRITQILQSFLTRLGTLLRTSSSDTSTISTYSTKMIRLQMLMDNLPGLGQALLTILLPNGSSTSRQRLITTWSATRSKFLTPSQMTLKLLSQVV